MSELENDNMMEQKPSVEFGYFGNRREQFNQELEQGFARGFGEENLAKKTSAKPKTRKKPAKKTKSVDAPAGKADKTDKGGSFSDGPKDLSKLPKGLADYWRKKRGGK